LGWKVKDSRPTLPSVLQKKRRTWDFVKWKERSSMANDKDKIIKIAECLGILKELPIPKNGWLNVY
jgi:hypothetical protein